jgi:hypothetical protein
MINIDKINGSPFREIPDIGGAFFKIEEEFNNLYYAQNFIENKNYKIDKDHKEQNNTEFFWFDNILECIIFFKLNMIKSVDI